jgi:hypothetical protein
MLWLYARASSPSRKLIRYFAAHEAGWLWYETSDASKVPDTGSHGTDLFKTHPDLPGIIVQWFVTTLSKTPGHAPADPLAAAAISPRWRSDTRSPQLRSRVALWPLLSGTFCFWWQSVSVAELLVRGHSRFHRGSW